MNIIMKQSEDIKKTQLKCLMKKNTKNGNITEWGNSKLDATKEKDSELEAKDITIISLQTETQKENEQRLSGL